jgi:gluconokinase
LNTPLILALDIGTSSVRAALYDYDGNVVPKTFVKNERTLTSTDDGGAEIDADEAFGQVVRAIDDVLKKAKGVKGEIEYVAASSFWHSLVGVGKNGAPTTKVFGWAETRPAKYLRELQRKFQEPLIHNRTGARIHSSFWLAKLFWLKKDFPKVFKKTDKWLSFSDLVALRLFDRAVTSVSMASGTGLFDIRKCAWDRSLANVLGISQNNLPEIAGRDSDTLSLNAEYIKRWPRLKEAKWFPAIGDGAANNIGAGCAQKSKAALMIGTSGAMRVAYRGKAPDRIPFGLWCYRIDRQRVIVGGALSDGGGLYRWLKDNLRLAGDDNKTEDEVALRVPDAHGLTFMPFLAGERSTGYHENASGMILGLKTSTGTIDIVQAALESVAYRFARIFDQLNNVTRVREVIASGGALRESPVWTQIIADVLGRNMSLPDTREASSRGAVLLALETIGKIEKIEKIPTPKGREFRFNKTRHAVYKKARERHEKAYQFVDYFNR